jgi:glycosyltransferase involved in cell wall biosynthesis
MATYNGKEYIKEQVSSILKQLSESDELIISDDGSIDGTTEILTELSKTDTRIRVLEGPKLGLIKNFENAIEQSKGEQIFLSDQDDIWLDRKVELMGEKLKQCDLVVSDCIIVDSNLHIIEDSFFIKNNSQSGIIKNIYKNSYLGCCMAFNRSILNVVMPFPKNIPMHDWYIGVLTSFIGKIGFLDDKLILYRRHGNNASPTGEKSTYSYVNKVTMRVTLLYTIILKLLRKRN